MQEKFFHMRTRIHKRSDGAKAVSKAAYRSGEKLFDEKYDRIRNYENKGKKDGIESEIFLPSHVSEKYKDRNVLYNEIERIEKRKDAQLNREIEFSLYTEFTPSENKQLVKRFSEFFTKKGMIADACFHKLKGDNPHVHLTLTMREIEKDGVTFNKKKNRDWNSKEMNEQYRNLWEELVNEMYKKKGLDLFVSRKSFQERGIDKIATKHLPWDKNSDRYKELIVENKKIKKRNNFKQKKKESKQEIVQVKEVKQIMRNSKIHGKEVLSMEAHRRFSKYEEQEQVQERTQTRTVGDLFKDHLQTLEAQYERLNNATRSLKENKKRSYERYCEYKETQYDKKMSLKKEDVIDMKLNYQMRKIDLKRTKVFSIRDFQRRKEIKLDMKKMKLQIKKKKLEMKREKKKLKLYKKEHAKDRKKLISNYKDRAKTFLQIKKTERVMSKVKDLNKQITNDKVVNLKDFKKEKIKLEMKPTQQKRNREIKF
ncbi:MobA/MobL family protein [Bacillus cereus group sp. LD113LC]|uniref:MobA/MobL family protein n=1 Tax=Bacillus cereus group TaxID=86661 RepID=UPI0019654425|nr:MULTISPECIES: MobA/MobL family protein [Bacillus cereus group]HDR3647225.1 MobA/MobL family protein [Bacillus paranthracis]MCU5562388.1 MobA/MobL family protein [Bacillus pacificus]MDA1625821.1 MobA/MobL family protein [Bacillus cereus group sp. TH206-1LC]MDA1753040.1 MobA/MobL family protein [Bacillus cereus group sp. LD113LC]MDX5917485.1 MobA/MobL family protein [Bacillus cereus group sp. BfR-BA-01026]